MGTNSKIEWCDHTFNPWRGCVKVAAGCANCYADSQAKRNPGTLGIWGDNGTRVVASESMWREPLKWDAAAKKAGERHRVFCASMADVFEDWQGKLHDSSGSLLVLDNDRSIPYSESFPRDPMTLADVRSRLFALIDATPHLDWLLLTKRPENIQRMWPDVACDYCETETCGAHKSGIVDRRYRRNVWLGTSIATQPDADNNIPRLRRCRDLSPVLFVSAEPLLGPVNLNWCANACDNCCPGECDCGSPPLGIDWLIVGGESGHNARPMPSAWVSPLRDQCHASGVPFYLKQWGEWCPFSQIPDAFLRSNDLDQYPVEVIDGDSLHRIGKKNSGRTLAGREWNQFPSESLKMG